MPTRHRTNIAAAVVAAALTLSGCGGGGSGSSGSGTTLTTATVALPKPANSAQAPAGMTMATVPDLDATTVDIFTTKPSASLPLTAADGKQYKAADGKELIAVGWMVRGDPTVQMDITHTISIVAEGKTLATQSVDHNTYSGGGGWIMSIPKTDKPVMVRISADGGQQNIPAGATKRDDATSNGLPVGARINAPVAAQTQCDNTHPTQNGQAGCENVAWTLTDHDPAVGWAKPGHALMSVNVPNVTAPMQQGGTPFDPTPRLVPEATTDAKLSNTTLDGQAALVAARDSSSMANPLHSVFDITPAQSPKKMTADVTWTGFSGYSVAVNGHASLALTGAQTHRLTLATSPN